MERRQCDAMIIEMDNPLQQHYQEVRNGKHPETIKAGRRSL